MATTIERLTDFFGLVPTAQDLGLPAATKVKKGCLACADINGRAIEGTTIAGGAVVALGKFSATVDNTAGANDALLAHIEYGCFDWVNSGTDPVSIADLFKPCYVVDNNTIARTSAGGTLIQAGVFIGFRGVQAVVAMGLGAIIARLEAEADLALAFQSGITANTTRTQAGATVLSKRISRVDTSTAPASGTTLGDGVVLPIATAGAQFVVINNTANLIQLYGNNTDTINGVAGATGVALPPGDVAFLISGAAGAWQFEAGLGSSGALSLEVAADAVSAAGTTQATATQLKAQINNVTTVAAGTGVNLPASASGLSVVVQNNGANPLLVYPFQGATDTVNGSAATAGVAIHPGTVAQFNCTAPGAWTVEPASPVQASFNTITSADANLVMTAAQATGAVSGVDAQITGGVAFTAGRNLQVPTVAQLIAALHAPTIGTSYRLRITNAQGGAFSATVVTNTGWTLTGTMTIAQNTWREFIVTLNTLTTATLRSVATGTFS